MFCYLVIFLVISFCLIGDERYCLGILLFNFYLGFIELVFIGNSYNFILLVSILGLDEG